MNLKKPTGVVLFIIVSLFYGVQVIAQEPQRPRIVTTGSSRPINAPVTSTQPQRQPMLQTITVATADVRPQPLVKKTVSSQPTNFSAAYNYGSSLNYRLLSAIESRYGIPYRYGSTGPNTYDCSGLVWSVFQDAGIKFDRSSAITYWNEFEPVTGDERFKFGTLVFFNNLGHVGIVADEKGFYQASSSKGVTYSPFEGYWSKRIVGFRRVPLELN
jgi:cell wall-associated NlpC family hydrolase